MTEGVGYELSKVNSLDSSSLLGLLTFHPYFGYKFGDSSKKLSIEGRGEYDSCLFEVRNRVINLPSCVDILLKNENEWLFLESKFHEPIRDCTDRLEVGIGYKELYEKIESVLNPQGIYISFGNNKLYLQTYPGEKPKETHKKYLYGIKQAISHLIGIVRGPHKYSVSQPNYPEDYHTTWDNVSKILFGTILYHSDKNDVAEYRKLYKSIFSGQNGETIKDAIYDWATNRKYKIATPKDKLTILGKPLIYQEIFTNNQNNQLPDKVAKFYRLGQYLE